DGGERHEHRSCCKHEEQSNRCNDIFEERRMKITRPQFTLTVLAAALAGALHAQEPIALDADDIGGVVTSPAGPEAGVWVIAETDAFGTRFAKIVVTDDAGRYVVPDLPSATYDVWVRGYGLADSAKSSATPGQRLDLTATPAPDETTAAQV